MSFFSSFVSDLREDHQSAQRPAPKATPPPKPSSGGKAAQAPTILRFPLKLQKGVLATEKITEVFCLKSSDLGFNPTTHTKLALASESSLSAVAPWSLSGVTTPNALHLYPTAPREDPAAWSRKAATATTVLAVMQREKDGMYVTPIIGEPRQLSNLPPPRRAPTGRLREATSTVTSGNNATVGRRADDDKEDRIERCRMDDDLVDEACFKMDSDREGSSVRDDNEVGYINDLDFDQYYVSDDDGGGGGGGRRAGKADRRIKRERDDDDW
eukprot:PhM_4_TR9181/c0_g1_i1/m.67752